MATAIMEVATVLETPVAPGIVRRADRGLCVADTRLSLFSLMDYLKAGRQQDLLTYGQLSATQLQLALDYLDAHRAECETAYTEYAQQAEELECHYRERECQRRAELPAYPTTPETPARAAIREHLQSRRRASESY